MSQLNIENSRGACNKPWCTPDKMGEFEEFLSLKKEFKINIKKDNVNTANINLKNIKIYKINHWKYIIVTVDH